MPLWGKTAASATNKPKWLPEDENSDYNKATVYASTAGWVVAPGTANSGSDNVNAQPEVLACIGGLSTTLAAPTVTKIRIVQSSIAAGSRTITAEITWDEKVTVAGSPQVVIANGNQGTGVVVDLTLLPILQLVQLQTGSVSQQHLKLLLRMTY